MSDLKDEETFPVLGHLFQTFLLVKMAYSYCYTLIIFFSHDSINWGYLHQSLLQQGENIT